MPRISYFYGIVIWMYWDDHNPPHFHATYGEFEILINITDFSVYAGFLLTRQGFRASYGMGVYSSARPSTKLGTDETITSVKKY